MKRPSKIFMAINIGKNNKGNTYIGAYDQPRNHWTLCNIDTIHKKILYGDKLGTLTYGGDPSSGQPARYIKAVNIDDSIKHYNVSVLYDPTTKCAKNRCT